MSAPRGLFFDWLLLLSARVLALALALALPLALLLLLHQHVDTQVPRALFIAQPLRAAAIGVFKPCEAQSDCPVKRLKSQSHLPIPLPVETKELTS